MSMNQQSIESRENSILLLEETRNGKKTLKVNGIYLHSKYDPEKEAKSFVTSNAGDDLNKNGFLILGLGLGYHIKELAAVTETMIYVLEASKNIYNLANEINNIENIKNVRVLFETDIDELFYNNDFVQFLSEKPKTIVHPSSFKAAPKYYQEFLSYRSDNILNEHSFSLVEDDYIGTSMLENETFDSFSNRLLQKDQLNQSEQLVLATYSLIK